MLNLTDEQINEYKEQVKAVEEGRLIRICNHCKQFYKVTKEDLGFINFCQECKKGVVIPTF